MSDTNSSNKISNKISVTDFLKKPAPVYWVKYNNDQYSSAEKLLIEKWLANNISSWFFIDSNYISFGSIEDRCLFSLWIKSDPFSEQYGEW